MRNRLCHLLTGKDLDTVRRALHGCREIVVERSMGQCGMRVHTCPAAAVWDVPYLARLEVWDGGTYFSQYFETEEQILEVMGRHDGKYL